MNRNTKIALIVILILTLLLGGLLLIPFSKNKLNTKSKGIHTLAPKIGEYKEIVISDKGFSPSFTIVNNYSVVHFINKTSFSVEISSKGSLKVETAPIPSGASIVSIPFSKTGIYDYYITGNPKISGRILVK